MMSGCFDVKAPSWSCERRFPMSDDAFLEQALTVAGRPYATVLLSGGDLDCARFSIAACDPFLVIESKGRDLKATNAGGAWTGRGDPLSFLDRALEATAPRDLPQIEPFSGGAVGYLAYELKNSIERLPQTARDDLQLPDLFFAFPTKILVHDRREGLAHEIQLDPNGAPPIRAPAPEAQGQAPLASLRTGRLSSNFTREGYLEAVRRIRGYIRAGDVYQVNLSQRFSFPLEGPPIRLWKALFEKNPAPFFAFVNAGDHQVLSTSMERFLFRRGSTIETRPIKGTRRRGSTPEEDAALARELAESEKDDAELSMIVDLLRNDLGRVCKPRSIRVLQHKRIERYQNVFHLVSIVTGTLIPGTTAGDLLRATFPGGSITGCPKIRAMEIIDELEPTVRHVYTGSIGYVGWHDNLDLNVAIRTAVVTPGLGHVSVGGGVVYDSSEQDEYEETLHKGRTFFEVVRSLEGKQA